MNRSKLASIFFLACCAPFANCYFESYLSQDHGKEYYLYAKFSENIRGYENVKKICQENNAQIVQIRSFEESQWIKQNINPWLNFAMGIQTVNDSDGTKMPRYFLDGSPIEWYNWCNGQPSKKYLNGEDCAYVMFMKEDTCWNKVTCSDSFWTVMCEKPIHLSWYMEELVKAVDELETRIVDDRKNATWVSKGEVAKEIGPTLMKVIDRIKALPKKR